MERKEVNNEEKKKKSARTIILDILKIIESWQRKLTALVKGGICPFHHYHSYIL